LRAQCFFKDGQDHFGGRQSCEFEYASCDDLEPQQCGGGEGDLWGVFENDIIKDKLYCSPSSWRECKTQETCESAGECHGGLRKHYCVNDENGVHTCGVRR
jgi:hypothetical protein